MRKNTAFEVMGNKNCRILLHQYVNSLGFRWNFYCAGDAAFIEPMLMGI